VTTAKGATETTYVLVLFLPARRRIKVGALGPIAFQPGIYFYVGSGGRTPGRRIARHARRRKRKFWHIDFLTAHAEVIGALLFEASRSVECSVAGALSEAFAPVPRFGSSDCTCASHLFHAPVQVPARTENQGGDT